MPIVLVHDLGPEHLLQDVLEGDHALEATEWCELIDVFTPPYTDDRADDYRRYGRSSEPVEGDDIYAAWEL